MNITEKILAKHAKDNNFDKLTTIIINSSNITQCGFKNSILQNIEYLCLKNNFIKDLNFLKVLPNLWYLDIRGNPIEDYDKLSVLSYIGFLGVSFKKYQENYLMNIRKLSIGIVELQVEDKEMEKIFLQNNPNILMFNEELIYLSNINNNYDNNKINRNLSLSLSLSYTNKNISRIFGLNLTQIINNEKQQKFKEFLDVYNKEACNIITEVKINEESIKHKKYIELEKDKIIKIYKIYESFIDLNSISENKIVIINKIVIKNAHIKIFDIFKISFISNNDLSLQFIVLIILILFIMNILGKEITIYMLKNIMMRFNTNENLSNFDNIQNILEMNNIIILGLYYDLYNSFINNYNKNLERQKVTKYAPLFDKIKYEEIIKNLEMNNLVLVANQINKNKKYYKDIFNKKLNNEIRHKNINIHIINYIDLNLQLFQQTIFIIQYLSDYIKSSNLDRTLLKDFPHEYKIFMEISGLFYRKLDRKSTIFNTISDKKYRDHDFKRLESKVYFSNKSHDLNYSKNSLFHPSKTIYKKTDIQNKGKIKI
jgi:hypothetical protein